MRLWPSRRRQEPPEPSPEARDAVWRARRALMDAERLDVAAEDMAQRLHETRARNHFAEAVRRSMRRA